MRILLKNANCLDFSHEPRFLSGDVLIEGDKISRIADQMDSLAEDYTLDLKGYFLLPGLIDMHVHLCWDGSVDPTESLRRESREMTLLRMVHHCRETLLSGITTVRDLGSIDDLSLDLSVAVEKGLVVGPRIIGAGKSLIMTGGHDPFWGICVDGPWEALKAARRQIEKGAGVLKVSATGGVYGREEREEVGRSELTREELESICREAHRRGIRVASHALGREGVANSFLAGCDTIEHGIFASEEVLQNMSHQGTCLTPTLFIYKKIAEGNAPGYAKEKAKRVIEQHHWCFSEAQKKGVKILAGSDAGSPEAPHPSLFFEMDEMVRLGMNPLEVIRIATLVNAEALGMKDILGSLKEGKMADILILKGDPSRDLSPLNQIWGILKRGIFVKQGNRIFS